MPLSVIKYYRLSIKLPIIELFVSVTITTPNTPH